MLSYFRSCLLSLCDPLFLGHEKLFCGKLSDEPMPSFCKARGLYYVKFGIASKKYCALVQSCCPTKKALIFKPSGPIKFV